MNLVIFGPPGAGKGTQSKFIVEKYNMFQLSTGEFLRKEMYKNTAIGKKISSVINSGALVSDQIVSMYSADLSPGLIPGIYPPYFLKFSAVSFGLKTIEV